MDLYQIKKESFTQPVAVVYKAEGRTRNIDYYINGYQVQLHRFKQRVKHLDPVKVITKHVSE